MEKQKPLSTKEMDDFGVRAFFNQSYFGCSFMSGVGESSGIQAHGFWGEDVGTKQVATNRKEGREGKDKERGGVTKTTTDEEMSDARFVPPFSPLAERGQRETKGWETLRRARV